MEINNRYAFDSEEEARKELKKHGELLIRIANRIWRKYLSSYQPKQYAVHKTGEPGKRTMDSLYSMKLGSVKKLDDNTLGIELTFVDDLAYHDSIFGGKKGHAIMLISAGWHSKKLENKLGKRVYRLTYYEGFGYLRKVREEFEELREHMGIELEIQWSGKYTK